MVLFIFGHNLFASEKITIGVPSEWDKELTEVKSLLKESYLEIGYDVEYKILPIARSIKELQDGQIDGEIARGNTIAQKYNLVLVNPPFITLKSFAYYKKSRFKKIPTIEDVKQGRLAFVNGVIYAELLFKDSKNVVKTNTESQLKDMLMLDRIDFAIPVSHFSTSKNGLGKILLDEQTINHVLSQKYKDLAAKISPVLKTNLTMKKNNRIQKNLYKILATKQK